MLETVFPRDLNIERSISSCLMLPALISPDGNRVTIFTHFDVSLVYFCIFFRHLFACMHIIFTTFPPGFALLMDLLVLNIQSSAIWPDFFLLLESVRNSTLQYSFWPH